MKALDAALAALATARLTRLVITDDLGERFIQTPADNLVERHMRTVKVPEREVKGFRQPASSRQEYPEWVWLRDGLTCPHCIGFWLGLGVLASHPLWARPGLPRTVVKALALNYVTAHAGTRLGDFSQPDDD